MPRKPKRKKNLLTMKRNKQKSTGNMKKCAIHRSIAKENRKEYIKQYIPSYMKAKHKHNLLTKENKELIEKNKECIKANKILTEQNKALKHKVIFLENKLISTEIDSYSSDEDMEQHSTFNASPETVDDDKDDNDSKIKALHWTQCEKTRLLQMHDEGKSVQIISEELQRTQSAIRQKLQSILHEIEENDQDWEPPKHWNNFDLIVLFELLKDNPYRNLSKTIKLCKLLSRNFKMPSLGYLNKMVQIICS